MKTEDNGEQLLLYISLGCTRNDHYTFSCFRNVCQHIFRFYLLFSEHLCPSNWSCKDKRRKSQKDFSSFSASTIEISLWSRKFFSRFAVATGTDETINLSRYQIGWNFYGMKSWPEPGISSFLRGSKFKYDFGWNVLNSIPVFALLSPLAMLPCFITITTI